MEARRNAAAGTEFGWRIRSLGIPARCAPQHNVSSRFSTLLEGFAPNRNNARATRLGTKGRRLWRSRTGAFRAREGMSVPCAAKFLANPG